MSTANSGKKSRAPMIVSTVIVLVLLFALAMLLLQPWSASSNTTVDEDLPESTTSSAPGGPSAPPTQAKNVVLGDGQFESLDQETSGNAALIRVTDGSTVLRLSDFSTASGPDVMVWLSEEPVSRADRPSEGRYITLGELKGNQGNQNYNLPAADGDREWLSVIIWSDRSSVAFGAARLDPGSPTPRR
jgi:hypothetical protein